MSHIKRPATQPLGFRWGFQTTSILGYRKLSQNAIFIEPADEGLALNPRGSILYNLASSEFHNLRALMTNGSHFI